MKSKMKPCAVCGAEIAVSAKSCPSCGAKNKKPIYKKWWFWVILVFLLAGAGSGVSDSDAPPSGSAIAGSSTAAGSNISNAPSSGSNIAGSSAAENVSSGPAEKPPVSYTHYNVTDLFDALKSNALKAEKTFKGQFVELEGYVSNIDSSGKYISIGAASGDFDYFLDSVQCYIKNNAQLEKVLDVNVGDPIVLRGKIKTVGEVIGYALDIDSID